MKLIEGKEISTNMRRSLKRICFPANLILNDAVEKYGKSGRDIYSLGYQEEQGDLIANVSTFRLLFQRCNDNFECFGIGGVSTHPDSRKRGLARDLIEKQLERIGNKNTLLVTKIPDMYKNFGFQEIPFNYYGAVCNKIPANIDGYVVRKCETEDDRAIIREMHKKIIASSNLFLPVRDARLWDYIFEVFVIWMADLYLVDIDSNCVGYFSARQEKGLLFITEVFSEECRIDTLLECACQHFGMSCIIPECIHEKLPSGRFSTEQVTNPFEKVMLREAEPMPEFYIPLLDLF